MATPGRRDPRIAVRIGSTVWREEVERFDERSPARAVAERERRHLEEAGIRLGDLERCAAEGPDGTRLAGLLKAYVPIADAPASRRPFGFVFGPAADAAGRFLAVVAFGERHPPAGARSVYERAHKRLHGRYPDQ